CSTVVGGLRAAARFAYLFGETELAEKYETTASEIVEAMREHLYSAELGRFLRALQFHGDDYFEPDPTVDASLFGTFYFGAFAANDELVANTMQAVREHLWARTEIGGAARYENDGYMRVASEKATGNPWFICSLWLADFYIARAASGADLSKALEILHWAVSRALPSGVLAEQVNPVDGAPVSVSPLTWSHSTFVAAVMNYLNKLKII
ncbi:MAG TPA: glycoside hydrolase family 15 protein, partial [Pyrinomonadaceae bacterium]|nr:glycoside hydrolase family 15 protein [Pyrinomonadaceae bacterium]